MLKWCTTRLTRQVLHLPTLCPRQVLLLPALCPNQRMAHSITQPTFFLGDGESISKDEFMQQLASSTANVICLGENHADSSAHQLQLEILTRLRDTSPSLALSLEFYQREAQTVLNEYITGLVPLETFLADSQPPANHEDYQQLIDFCKAEQLPVIAANCPRRYTRTVAKHGKDFLVANVDGERAGPLLPPLPYASASEAYKSNFLAIMGRMGNTGSTVATNMLDAQSLWDATMAHSIALGLQTVERVVHVTGYFHIGHRLGTVEHLANYAPHSKILTVVILPSDDQHHLDDEQKGIADLVVLTNVEALD